MTRVQAVRYMSFGLLTVMAYVLLWIFWRDGTVIAKSNWNHGNMPRAEIQVRRVPSSAPWWALPLFFVPEESPSFRSEYYQRGSNVVYSSQTIRSVSYATFNEVTIQWRDTGEAVIYFDSDPLLTCDVTGVWRILK